MDLTDLQRIEPGPGETAHTLSVTLPALPPPADTVLLEKVEHYLRAFLIACDRLDARACRTGPLRYRIVCATGLSAGLEWIRADLAGALFGVEADAGSDGASGAVSLRAHAPEPYEDYVCDAIERGPAEPSADLPALSALVRDDAPAPENEAEPFTLALDLAGFRQDVAMIADQLRSGPSIATEIAAFRDEVDDMAEGLRHTLDAASERIERAAERAACAAAALPDPDRFELIMARNEASAAILERGVAQALSMLTDACRAISGAADAAPARSLPLETGYDDWAPSAGDYQNPECADRDRFVA